MLRRRRRELVPRLAMALAVAVAAALCGGTARADSWAKATQLHFRTGPFSGSYSGPATGSFSLITPVDLEYEIFISNKGSFTIRSIIGHDFAEGRMQYAYIGVGRRFYLFSKGMAFESLADGEKVSAFPKIRYYAGIDAGIAQVEVQRFGPVLSAMSALIDFGPHVGAIYQLGKSFGLEAHLGFTLGMGFSSVSVGSSTLRMFVGGAYHF